VALDSVAKVAFPGTSRRVTPKKQAGFTLVEAAISAAIVAVAAGGALLAMGAIGHFATNQAGPMRTAAAGVAEQTLRLGQNAWKYGSPGSLPAGSATVNVPLIVAGSASTSAPVTVSTSLTNVTATQAQLAVSVTYAADRGHPADSGSLSISGPLTVKAPLPGTRVTDPAAIPEPSGAP
jgi:Tfp pilus assembly protein PilV